MADEKVAQRPYVDIHKIHDSDELDRVHQKGRGWRRRKHEIEMIMSRRASNGVFPYILVLDHLKAGFNVPKIIRTANALGCLELHFINITFFDPTPAKGSLKYTRTKSFPTFDESYRVLKSEGYKIFAMKPEGTQTLGSCGLPEKTAFVLGHEEYGLSFDVKSYPDIVSLNIQQFGKVQSLNVSIAASLACFEYVRQYALFKNFLPASSKNL